MLLSILLFLINIILFPAHGQCSPRVCRGGHASPACLFWPGLLRDKAGPVLALPWPFPGCWQPAVGEHATARGEMAGSRPGNCSSWSGREGEWWGRNPLALCFLILLPTQTSWFRRAGAWLHNCCLAGERMEIPEVLLINTPWVLIYFLLV